MRVLVVSQYFWPEYFRINDLVEALQEKNIEVDILTSYPNYPSGKIFLDFAQNQKKYKYFKKSKVYRVPQYSRKNANHFHLTINYLSFLFSGIFFGFFKLRKKKYDVVFTFATSPIIVALVSIFFSKIKKAKHVLWILDLWPNVLNDLNVFSKRTLIYKIFTKVVKFIYTCSDLILCQSISYKKAMLAIDKKFIEKIQYFPSWPEINNNFIAINKIADKQNKNIIFTGNIGEAQNFELVLKVIKLLTNQNITWTVIGEGRKFHWLSEEKRKNPESLKKLILLGSLKFENIQEYINKSDYLLISLKSGESFDSTIPGKFQTYVNYRKPIIGLIGGEVNLMIDKYKIGMTSNSQNPEYLANLINEFVFKKDSLITESKSFTILNKIFDKKRNILKLIYLFKNLIAWKKIITLKLLTKPNNISYKKNFILSAINLAFLGSLANKKIKPTDDFYLWPDGHYFTRIVKRGSVEKIPGRTLLVSLKLSKDIKRIYVLGNLSEKAKFFLEKKFEKEIIHVVLPFGDLINFKNYVPTFDKDDVCFLTLPTPKQEILASYIATKNKHFKIFCFGGAVSMACGQEKQLPLRFDKYIFAETLWRLQYDSWRRVKRLILTFASYLIGRYEGFFNKVDIIYIDEEI